MQSSGSGKPWLVQTVCLALAPDEGHKASLSPSVKQGQQQDYSIHCRINIRIVLRMCPGRVSCYSSRRQAYVCSVMPREISAMTEEAGT